MCSARSQTGDAEDLVSDVFLKAYEKYPTFDADRASVSTWLYTITRNTVIDYFRTHRPGVELPDDLPEHRHRRRSAAKGNPFRRSVKP